MKAFLVLDELNQFHWAMLKSVLLILALLPIAEVSLKLWLSTEGSSQIMANSNMRCDSFKSHMIINKLSKFL